MKFCSGGEKMRIVSGHRGENERQQHFLHKTCNQEVSGSPRCSRAKQRQRNVQKKCAARAKLLFLLIRPVVVFLPFSLPSPLSISRFYILFEQTINIIEIFAFRPA